MPQHPPGPATGPGPDPLQPITEHIEAVFNDHRAPSTGRPMTLTDKDTAAHFTVSLDLVLHALEGAVAQGILTPEQQQRLVILIEGMQQAPRLV